MSEQELKVGDWIALDGRLSGVSLLKITKVTPTLYVCEHHKFRKDGLRVVGHDRFGPYAGRVPTQKDFLSIRIRKATDKLRILRVTEENLEDVEILLGKQP